tara:strand:- start:1306 stop:1545 length:240 start_codon:yes stop_codon:yes gene_type:complete
MYVTSTPDRAVGSRGGIYSKDDPIAVKKRDDSRVYFNGIEVSKRNPCFKFLKAGRYKGRFAGLMSMAINTIGSFTKGRG